MPINIDPFDLIAASLQGVKRLRELILELAVRGKLVPQDASDEPASELLKRILAEKAKLVTEGKIKQDKPLPEIGEDEKPFELPGGWELYRLDNLLQITGGVTLGRKLQGRKLVSAPYLRVANVQRGYLMLDIIKTVEVPVEEVAKYQLLQGDLLITEGGDWDKVGRTAIWSSEIPNCLHQNHVFRARKLVPDWNSSWAAMYLNSYTARKYFAGSSKQTTNLASINMTQLRSCVFPIPPLPEQHRIVAKVDELMALCDRLEAQQTDAASAHATLVKTLLDSLSQSGTGNAADFSAGNTNPCQRIHQHFDTLFSTEASITALKQTVLQLAVMGKLVPQDPNDEPASELLKRIQTEKLKLIAEGKFKKVKLPPEIGADEKPFELPDEWEWVYLSSLVSNMDAGWSPACHDHASPTNEIWGVLRTTAVQAITYLEYENKELPPHLTPKPEYEVRVGDILITRAGPKNRVGISCLVRQTRPRLMISDKIIRFHLLGDLPFDRYVSLCLNAGATAQYLEAAKSGMAESQMNISQDKLRRAPIPLPPVSEQHRIVAKVDELMALCDQLAARLKIARELSAHYASTATAAVLKTA